ncbi:MAG TPA: hypothetical protein VH184_03340 [Dongiaceae bacterium]|nr:hypothetical protein [Dongiaceae bacterium]
MTDRHEPRFSTAGKTGMINSAELRLPTRQARHRALRWILAFVITAVFAALQINESFSAGTLAFPPIFDAVNYYLSGAAYLKPFRESGFGGILRAYLAGPPHAPMSTFLAFIGFAVLGIKPWVGPISSAVVLFFFVNALLGVAADLALGHAILLAIAFLGFPLIGDALMTFKPDWFCALLAAAGSLFILLRPDWLTSRRDQLIAGAILGAALWAKPTVFHVVIGLFGAAMLLASLQALRQWNIKTAATAGLVTMGTGILISLPYYALELGHVLDYIWTTAFGAEAKIWVEQRSLRDHVLFYLIGPIGTRSLGLWLYAGPVIAAALVLRLRASGDWKALHRTGLTIALIVLAYLGVTIPAFKGVHGLVFAALFLTATAVGTVVLVRRLPRPLAWSVCIALLLFSAWQFMWPYTRARGAPADPVLAASRWGMLHKAVSALGEGTEATIFYETTPLLYLNYSTVAFQDYVEGRIPPSPATGALIVDLEQQRKNLATADIVFAPAPNAAGAFPSLPTAPSAFRAEMIKLIESTGRFGPAIRIADPLGGGPVLFYMALPAFGAFEQEEGLSPVVSLSAPENLANVRWGLGARSSLIARGKPNSAAKLTIQARAQAKSGQTLNILIDDRIKVSVPLSDIFASFDVPFEFNQDGRARILVRYGTPADKAVLYKVLAVRAATP